MAKFAPIPKKLEEAYRFDLKRIYKTEKAFKKDIARVEALGADLLTFRGKLGRSAKDLREALLVHRTLVQTHMRVAVYAMLRWAIDVKDLGPKAQSEALASTVGQATSFFSPELMALGEKKIAAFLKKDKALREWQFFLESSLRYKKHTLKPAEERVLAAVGPHLSAWHDKLYNLLLARTDFGYVKTPGGTKLHVRRQAGEAVIHEANMVRRGVYKMRHEGYERYRDLHAFQFIHQFEMLNELARLCKFKDFPEEAAYSRWMTAEQVEAIFGTVRENAELFKRYQRARRSRVRNTSLIRRVRAWDMALQKPGFRHPRFNVGDATKTVRLALAPLGKEYLKLYDDLMNPKKGRLDIVGGPDRSPGGFSTRTIPGQSVVYGFNWQGFYGDLSFLAHEVGHAIQGDLMLKAKLPFESFQLDPGYVTEGFALLNELLLLDHLVDKARGAHKLYYRERLAGQLFHIFSSVETASLEWALYRAADRNELATADDLDALTREHASAFSIWPAEHKQSKNEWMQVMHYTAAPGYYLNYVMAKFCGIAFYQKFKTEKGFAKKYLSLIKNGFDRPPVQLLVDFCGIDLSDPKALLESMFAMQELQLEALVEDYEKD